MKTQLEYRGQRILCIEDVVCFYLYNEDGDIEEYRAKNLNDAKVKIDAFYNENSGFYDADGNFYTDAL